MNLNTNFFFYENLNTNLKAVGLAAQSPIFWNTCTHKYFFFFGLKSAKSKIKAKTLEEISTKFALQEKNKNQKSTKTNVNHDDACMKSIQRSLRIGIDQLYPKDKEKLPPTSMPNLVNLLYSDRKNQGHKKKKNQCVS